jgi:3-methyladenine DNA glycosylase AlkD
MHAKKKNVEPKTRATPATSSAGSRTPSSTKAKAPNAGPSIEKQVGDVLAALKRLGDKRVLEDMPKRYGIVTSKAFGVSMSDIQKVAKPLGKNHELALALWDTGWYEARMMTSFVDDPDRVTADQMDRWCGDFDNWAICDTLCFNLFDRTPHAWGKAAQWCKRKEEFIKRSGFALLWALTVHDKQGSDEQFKKGLAMIASGADDDRNFVKKAVSMALRAIGKRNLALNAPAVALARRLADSDATAARWIGKDALKELTSSAVTSRLRNRSRRS